MNEFTLEKETINILSLDILKFYHESAQKRLSDHRDQEKIRQKEDTSYYLST